MKLEVRIPISPEPHFFRQVEYLWRAFATFGGIASNARFVVSVGADCEPYDLNERNPWNTGAVQWRWVDRDLFRRQSFFATGFDRLSYGTDADIVLLSDADTLLVRNIDDLLLALIAQPAIAGVMAYVPPFLGLPSPPTWEQVFAAAGRRLPPDRFQHPGWGGLYAIPEMRFGPAYYNMGAVFVPGPLVERLGAESMRQFSALAPTVPIHPQFRGQFALTLAIYALDAPRLALEPRFNFHNDEWADRRLLMDLADVRIVHYLREHVIGTRQGTWGADANFAHFIQRRDLVGSNEILRRAVARLYEISRMPAAQVAERSGA